MAVKGSPLMLALANLLIPVALLIFATGFFPYKPFIPGHAAFPDPQDGNTRAQSPFDRVIFMVVDALRSDFVYSNTSGFAYVQSLIRSGAAMPFTAHATSPTITMPRVKAITTGSIPSFLDVILNFAESDTTSSLANQDTWLSQLKDQEGGKLVMYGDDTWLKLFPGTFSRADGTSSFFVSDFTEVDDNVTRHIPWELGQSDWNGMILHYLGLDHIGHKSGPRSPHMKPKQSEMDAIIRQMYKALETENHLQSTLLVLCGDHGMNDAGNHGGSAEGETSPALIFMSPKLKTIPTTSACPSKPRRSSFDYYATIEQSDIAPTLAGLLGFPIPLNNIGVFIPHLLLLWPEDSRVQLLLQNARQMLRIVRGTFPAVSFDGKPDPVGCHAPASEGKTLSCMWSEALSGVGIGSGDNKDTLMKLQTFCKRAQEIVSSTASNYNVLRLIIGILMAATSVLFTLWSAFGLLQQSTAVATFITLTTTAYATMMFASSYVEEEQHFWQWVLTAWLAWLFLRHQGTRLSRPSGAIFAPLLLLASHRIIRAWNQTGQKHAGEPDIARHLLPAHNYMLWILVSATYADVMQRISRCAIPWSSRRFATAASIPLGVAALGFKIAFTNADAPELLTGLGGFILTPLKETSLVAQARAVLICISFMVLLTIMPIFVRLSSQRAALKGLVHPLHVLLTLFLITQSRATNIPIYLLFQIQYLALDSLSLSSIEITLTSLLMQYNAFFSFGGSNAISSVDLSNAYNGVSGYNVGAVGLLTFVSNWAGPIWWSSASMVLLSQKQRSKIGQPLEQHLFILTAFVSESVLAVMLACTLLRTHLFIWTVFSPKYLYSMAWCICQHLCINCAVGSLMYWIGSH